VSTVFFAALFVVLRPRLGVFWADVVALGSCAVANTEANRRLTFTFGDRSRLARRHLAGLLLATLPLAANLITLAVLAAAGVESTFGFLAALTVVNGVTALARFILPGRWVFRPQMDPRRRGPGAAPRAALACSAVDLGGCNQRRPVEGLGIRVELDVDPRLEQTHCIEDSSSRSGSNCIVEM
jgi:hypothetical protein